MAHNHYDAYITTCMRAGMSPYEAGLRPEAKEAHERDRADERTHMKSATKQDFLSTFRANRAAEGGPQGFADQEEMMLAMQDPAYETNENYRAAIAEILSHTPAEVVGVSATAVSADGTRMEIGRQLVSEKATVGSMMTNAFRDMVIEHLQTMDLSTAKGRYEYMRYCADPANAEALQVMEELVTTDSDRTNRAMLESQGAGQVDRYTAPVESPIDMPEGTIIPGKVG